MPRKKQHKRKPTTRANAKNGKPNGAPEMKEKENVTKSETPQRNPGRAAKRRKSEVHTPKSPDRGHNSPQNVQTSKIINTAGAEVTLHPEACKESSKSAKTQETPGAPSSCSLPGVEPERLYELPLEWEWENVEDREHYRIGGFHPIHVDEFLDEDERFEVVNKLGFGVHSTVWVCLDRETGRLRAVKVLRADQSTDFSPELRIQNLLKDYTEEEVSDNHIIASLEHFWINGPNGRHLCLVLPLVGTSIDSTVVQHNNLQSLDMLKSISYQVAKGAQFLHQKGICHGDLTPANVLYQIDRDDSLTFEETSRLLEILEEEVRMYEIVPRSNQPSKHGAPKYLVRPISTRELTEQFGRGKVAIADFGLSYLTTDSNKSQEFPACHSSPGLMIENLTGKTADDVWSLACTIYHIMTGKTLFYGDAEDGYKIATLEWLFGPLPEIYRQKARKMFATTEKLDEDSESLKSPRISDTKLDLLSKVYMKDYDDFMKLRQRRCRFLKEWPQPIQALLKEPIWRDDESSTKALLESHGEEDGRTEENKNSSEQGPIQPNTARHQAGNADEAETYIDLHYVDARGPLINESKPQGLKDEDAIHIREQYDLLDQLPSSHGVKEYSMKREEILVLSDLLLQMFQLDPEKRININEVLDHQWFGEVKSLV